MKILSIIIPAYNTELYINRCLDSLIYNTKILDDIEIIVVDDGSCDDTVRNVQYYCKKYPKTIKLIQKENGGHGSTINVGIKKATGEYLRVVDSDDWVNIVDFQEYIKRLKKETADIVITNYEQDILYKEKETKFVFSNKEKNTIKSIKVAEKMINDENFFFRFSMHSMTVKTKKLLENWGEGLLEKTFFVDQQYVAKIIECADTFIEYDLDIYRYFIGRPEQSVSTEGLYRHRNDHERVLKWLLEKYNTTLKNTLKKVLFKQISLMIETQYDNYLGRKKMTKAEKGEIIQFDKYLKEKFTDFSTPKRLKFKLSRIYKTRLMKGVALIRRTI